MGDCCNILRNFNVTPDETLVCILALAREICIEMQAAAGIQAPGAVCFIEIRLGFLLVQIYLFRSKAQGQLLCNGFSCGIFQYRSLCIRCRNSQIHRAGAAIAADLQGSVIHLSPLGHSGRLHLYPVVTEVLCSNRQPAFQLQFDGLIGKNCCGIGCHNKIFQRKVIIIIVTAVFSAHQASAVRCHNGPSGCFRLTQKNQLAVDTHTAVIRQLHAFRNGQGCICHNDGIAVNGQFQIGGQHRFAYESNGKVNGFFRLDLFILPEFPDIFHRLPNHSITGGSFRNDLQPLGFDALNRTP